ncbi:peptide chain release factor N(5)-glutamine methyltransferase [Alphaproteobacteria bacterium]|nr:peptide chain release factor N(5)-glutamine methyltransferase [Alphaproteobacteria bacterium]
MTVENLSKIYDKIFTSLKDNNINYPDVEAKIIINFTSQADFSEDKVNFILKKRLEGMPLAKIINQKGFWNDIFYTNEDTLDPRADSEVLVESIIKDYDAIKTKKINFIDLCSGTGCLGLSLLKELPNSHCLFIDISPKAMKINQLNAKLLNQESRSTFLISDLLSDPNLKLSDIKFIVANPPYIRSPDIKKLNNETSYDPLLALDGGSDGCDFYRSIIDQLKYLKYKGDLYLEVDPIIKDNLVKLVIDNNAKILYIKKDYLGLERLFKITLT